MGPSYPIFSCPNCRAAADLDMDVEEVSDEWQQLDSGPEEANDNPFADNASQQEAEPDRQGAQSAQSTQSAQSDDVPPAVADVPQAVSREVEMGDSTVLLNSSPAAGNTTLAHTTTSSPVAIPSASRTPTAGTPSNRGTRTPSPTGAPLANCTEGPMTPRNDAGPWVFDGDAGRASQDISRPGAMNSLDAATNRVGVNTA